MPMTRRDQSKEKLWRYRINRQRSSGMTVPQFCSHEMLNEHNFRSWQATIKSRDEENERKAKVAAEKKEQRSKSTFIPVTLTDSAVMEDPRTAQILPAKSFVQPNPELTMEVLTPTGNIIRFFGATDVGLLRVILATLGRGAC